MKSGEIWFNHKEQYHVKIEYIETYKDYEWVAYVFCDERGDIGPLEYQSGDTMDREQFVKEFTKLYETRDYSSETI